MPTRNHNFNIGDTVQVRIPAGYWDPLSSATQFPFARVDKGDLVLEAEIVEFLAMDNEEEEDTAKVETVRGEVHAVDLKWIVPEE